MPILLSLFPKTGKAVQSGLMLILTTRWRQRSMWELRSSARWPLEGSDNAGRLRMLPVGQQWRQMWYILSGSTSDSIRLVSHPDTLFRIFGFCRRGSAFINNHAFYCVWSKEKSGNLSQMDFIRCPWFEWIDWKNSIRRRFHHCLDVLWFLHIKEFTGEAAVWCTFAFGGCFLSRHADFCLLAPWQGVQTVLMRVSGW